MDARQEEMEFEHVSQDFQRKRRFQKREKKANQIINQLLGRRGFSQTLVNEEIGAAWEKIVAKTILGEHAVKKTRTGNVKSGVLEIIVDNSSIHQELMFQKKSLLKAMTAYSKQLTDLRFRIGTVE